MPNPTTIPLHDLFRLELVLDGTLAPDGTQVVYEQLRHEADSLEKRSTLYLVSADGGAAQALTDGAQLDGTPRWSPDGAQIAYLSRRGDYRQIHLLDLATRASRQLTNLPLGVGGDLAWSPDGAQIAFTANPLSELPAADAPYRVTRNVYRFDEVGYVDRAVQEIFVMDSSGDNLRRLTHDNGVNSGIAWSPAGDAILHLSALAPDRYALMPSLHVVNLEGACRTLVEEWGYATTANWLPGSAGVVFAGVQAGKDIGTQEQLWLIHDVHDDDALANPMLVSTGFGFKVGGGLQADMQVRATLRAPRLRISDDGVWVYAQAQVGGTVQILRFALDGGGAREIIATGDRTCSLLDMRGNTALYLCSDLLDPVQLCACKADGIVDARDVNHGERVLTALNRELLAGWDQPTIEHLLYPSVDGEQIEGWLMKPGNGQAPWPTVVYVHGGPHSAFGHIFSFDFRMLAAAGFAVLFVNQRASTGYGDAFATAIKGDWGNLDWQDIEYGVDEVIARGLADGDRLGICGLSGGGNLTCWAVGNTHRYKAAVPENPVTNWNSFYGVSDIGVYFSVKELGGHPWEIPDVYVRCSPITYAHKCRTPTLLIQGESDHRCPAEQAEQFYTMLKVNNCPVEMVRIPGSSHGGAITGNAAQCLAQNEALLGWMQRWVLAE